MTIRDARLVLADGTVFEGEAVGAEVEVATGAVVFNTAMTGYQEVISDPTYAGTIISFTYPHIGNCGTTDLDAQSSRPACHGVVVTELARRRSNWRSQTDLADHLIDHGIGGIAGVDTRRLTRHIREAGEMRGAFGTADETTLKAAATALYDDTALVASVTTASRYSVDHRDDAAPKVIVYDFGIKRSLLERIARFATVEVVTASTPASEVIGRHPDGVVFSNGPGDPLDVPWALETVRSLVGVVPVLGIGLGHQLAGLALGGRIERMRVGHHGANHPVRRVGSDSVDITAHHHSHALTVESLEGVAELTHVDLDDGVVEGFREVSKRVFGLQFHPETGPNPRDADDFVSQFVRAMTSDR